MMKGVVVCHSVTNPFFHTVLNMEVFQLNNQEPKSRVQRYNFNADDQRPPRHRRRQRRWWPWLMTLITLAVAILLVMVINGHKSATTHSVASSSSNSSVLAHSTSASEATAYSQFSAKLDTYTDSASGLTATQKQALQTIINNEKSATVQAREQKLLDRTTTQSATSSSDNTSSNADSTSSTKKSSSQNPTSFDTTHTFSSVGDAQNWAQASKSQWLQAGYSTYTITSDGQGNYNLQFVR